VSAHANYEAIMACSFGLALQYPASA